MVGIVFIDSIVGSPNTGWSVKVKDTNYTVVINCSDNNGKLIKGKELFCSVDSQDHFTIKKQESTILVFLDNGSYYLQKYDINNDKFIVPMSISRIEVNFDIITGKNESLKVSSGHLNPKFYTKEEERQREKDFLTYFFGLLFISILTIPRFIITIRDSWINNQK